MLMSEAEQRYVAMRAQWYWDVLPNMPGYDDGDSVVLTGDGLDDLNSAILFVNRYPRCSIMCEAGQAANVTISNAIPLGNAFPKWVRADVQDIYAVKDYYIEYYGSVNKPPLLPYSSSARELPSPIPNT